MIKADLNDNDNHLDSGAILPSGVQTKPNQKD